MALSINEKYTRREPAAGKIIVAIDSDKSGPPFQEAFDELNDREAINLAMDFAARLGISPPRLNGSKIGPYPVNADGIPLEEVRGERNEVLPQTDLRMEPKSYRIDVPVVAAPR